MAHRLPGRPAAGDDAVGRVVPPGGRIDGDADSPTAGECLQGPLRERRRKGAESTRPVAAGKGAVVGANLVANQEAGLVVGPKRTPRGSARPGSPGVRPGRRGRGEFQGWASRADDGAGRRLRVAARAATVKAKAGWFVVDGDRRQAAGAGGSMAGAAVSRRGLAEKTGPASGQPLSSTTWAARRCSQAGSKPASEYAEGVAVARTWEPNRRVWSMVWLAPQARFRRPVGGDQDEGNPPWLASTTAGNQLAGADPEVATTTTAPGLGQAEGEEGGGAFIDHHRTRQAGAQEGEGQRRRNPARSRRRRRRRRRSRQPGAGTRPG